MEKKKKINGLGDASDIEVEVQIIVASFKIKITRTQAIHGGCCSYRHYFKLKNKIVSDETITRSSFQLIRIRSLKVLRRETLDFNTDKSM